MERVPNIPHYRCLDLACGHTYEGEKNGPTQCPKCLGLYVKWLNYPDHASYNSEPPVTKT